MPCQKPLAKTLPTGARYDARLACELHRTEWGRADYTKYTAEAQQAVEPVLSLHAQYSFSQVTDFSAADRLVWVEGEEDIYRSTCT